MSAIRRIEYEILGATSRTYLDVTLSPLKRGSKGDNVKVVQQALANAGFSPGATDGDYGRKTEAAVKAFQKAKGLTVDGVVGQQTVAALGLAMPSAEAKDVPKPAEVKAAVQAAVQEVTPATAPAAAAAAQKAADAVAQQGGDSKQVAAAAKAAVAVVEQGGSQQDAVDAGVAKANGFNFVDWLKQERAGIPYAAAIGIVGGGLLAVVSILLLRRR